MIAESPSAQSLAHGAAGQALLDIERALTGTGTWSVAKATIQTTARSVATGADTCLFYGAPATAFVLSCAAGDGHHRYQHAARTLDTHVKATAVRKLAAHGDRTTLTFADYDLFRGLTGLAALLLRSAPDSDTLTAVLERLVTLTHPRNHRGQQVPGWWVDHDPDPLLPTPGGHANLGMAHGAAGILAVLALAARAGHAVPGQTAAIIQLVALFAAWRQQGDDGPWWPQWLTRDDLREATLTSHRLPPPPSWCYGASGIARALQLAALATGDTAEQDAAETALAASLADRHLDRLDGSGLCHGIAGAYQTAFRASRDARTAAVADRLPALTQRLSPSIGQPQPAGLLNGRTGIALAAETARHEAPPRSGWDRCLLIS